jgi:nitroreductase
MVRHSACWRTQVPHLPSTASGDLGAVLRGRRSIDLFAPDAVTVDLIRDAVDLARWAPNHRLTEPWHFYLLGPATRRAVIDLAVELETVAKGERAGVARRARLDTIPGMFVLTTRRSLDPLLDREDYAACCCAAENLMLYLWQRGIGVKWTTGGITRQQRFYELLQVDSASEAVVGFFWYGVPKVVPTQRRRPVAEIVTELT